jgi:hypothetical protein
MKVLGPNTLRQIGLLAVVSLIVLGLSQPAQSSPITTPTGLNPGDQYRLAFVTSSQRDPLSSNIADYNAFVTAAASTQAALVALGTVWTAIASTNSVDARDNTGTNPFNAAHADVPIYLLDGTTKIADNNADLWDGSLDHALSVNETGGNGPLTVRTGTEADGTATPIGSGGALGTPGATLIGFSTASGADWIAASTLSQTVTLHFYGLSDVLTFTNSTPVAAPGGVAILGLGIVVLGRMRRRERR